MVKKIMRELVSNLREVADELKEREIDEFIDLLIHSREIFVVGAGRSGLVGKAFAMRLMHLGFSVYVVGETITPSIKPGDLLVAISGSGRTASSLVVAQTAKKMGINIATITSYPNSPLGKLSDCVVEISGRAKGMGADYISKQLTGEHEPLTPLGTLFEVSAIVFLDSLIAKLMKLFEKKETEMKKRHADLE